MTSTAYEGDIRLGVPHDIVFPVIPGILKRLSALFPRVRVNLASSFTLTMKEAFARGALDVIVTTETRPDAGGEVLGWRDLVWIGAEGGSAWQQRPLRLGFKDTCIFRPAAQAALTAAGLPWDLAYDGESEQAIEATVAADLAISARLEGQLPAGTARIDDRGALPPLGRMAICLYAAPTMTGPAAESLLADLRRAYCCDPAAPALAAE
jgi:DNA-binding transcriptional LysR family regulator